MNSKLTTRTAVIFGLACSFGIAPQCKGVFFDLRGLTPSESTTYKLSSGGITVALGGTGQKMTSHATTFGIDLSSPNDDPLLIDGAGGNERFAFSFPNSAVRIESLLISQFDAVDSGTFSVKGVATIPLANGVVPVGLIAGATSAHTLAWTGDAVSGAGRGFSVDGITVSFVPEPASAILLIGAVFAMSTIRRRSIETCAA